MRALKPVIGVIAVVLSCGSASTALADQSLVYYIHKIPDDPNSAVVFSVTLNVAEAQQDGNSIGWRIVEAQFDSPDDPACTWIKSDPPVATSDGLWWIEHADPNNPAVGEFVMPPQMTGTASAQDPNDADLDFSFQGVGYDAQLRGSPYEVTGALNYSFTLVGETAPLEEGEDQPAEIRPRPPQ